MQRRALWLKFQSWKHLASAQSLGVSVGTVNQWSSDPPFKQALVALTDDLDAQSREALLQLRSQVESGAGKAIAALTQVLNKPELKHHELMAASDGLLRWFQALHPEPRQGIAVSASASADNQQAHSTVFIYQGDAPGDEQRAALMTDSDVAIWMPDNGRDTIDVSG